MPTRSPSIFLLQSRQPLRIDPRAVLVAAGAPVALLTTPAMLATLTDAERRGFHEICILPELSDEPTPPALRERFPPDTLSAARFVTNDEYCLRLCARLNGPPSSVEARLRREVLLTDKVAMKEAVQRAGLGVPRFARFEPERFRREGAAYLASLVRAIGLPMIGKPVSESNSRDVVRLDTPAALHAWAERHAAATDRELEQLVEGTPYHCNTVLRGGVRHAAIAGEYLGPLLALGDGRPAGSIVLPRGLAVTEEILAFNEAVLDALGDLGDRVTHLELFREPDGRLVFLEIAGRAPGALVSWMTAVHADLQLEEVNFRLQLGDVGDVSARPGPCAAWLWHPAPLAAALRRAMAGLGSGCEVSWFPGADPAETRMRASRGIGAATLLWNDSHDALRADFTRLGDVVDSPRSGGAGRAGSGT